MATLTVKSTTNTTTLIKENVHSTEQKVAALLNQPLSLEQLALLTRLGKDNSTRLLHAAKVQAQEELRLLIDRAKAEDAANLALALPAPEERLTLDVGTLSWVANPVAIR